MSPGQLGFFSLMGSSVLTLVVQPVAYRVLGTWRE
jgi:hypothetical protein